MTQVPSRDEVREALSALYDNVQLSKASLGLHFARSCSATAMDERAEMLRSLLLEAIESLRPRRRSGSTLASMHRGPRGSSFGSPVSRGYDAINLRYLESMTLEQMETELSLGRRQIYRELEAAEERLAELLGSWARADDTVGVAASPSDPLSDELLALSSEATSIDLRDLVNDCVVLVGPLLEAAGTEVVVDFPAPPNYAIADEAVLRQVVVQMLSCAIQPARQWVKLEADTRPEDHGAVRLQVRLSGRMAGPQHKRFDDACRIASARGMHCSYQEGTDSSEITIALWSSAPVSVLLIEDNPGAVELYRRYLSSPNWRLDSVTDPREALDAARRVPPDVIILDIMMPHVEGWTILRMLRETPETRKVPVVVCSVVDNPELALALGAHAFLAKPVAQGQLLATLRLCVVQAGSLQKL